MCFAAFEHVSGPKRTLRERGRLNRRKSAGNCGRGRNRQPRAAVGRRLELQYDGVVCWDEEADRL